MTKKENLQFDTKKFEKNNRGARSSYDENGQLWVDLTEVPELVKKLETPTRVVQYRVGSVMYRVLRGANDPTPDNVVRLGGVYHNLDTGQLGRELKDVVDMV